MSSGLFSPNHDTVIQVTAARGRRVPGLPRIWSLRTNMTAYDAAYVALAEALGGTLVTRDERLATASGTRAQIELL